jgi:hypothetical protein
MDGLNSGHIEPRIIKRVRGGVLAVSPRNAAIRIGVIAADEASARSEFASLVAAWAQARAAEIRISCLSDPEAVGA